jgi:hypothetical protein
MPEGLRRGIDAPGEPTPTAAEAERRSFRRVAVRLQPYMLRLLDSSG